jgi:dihydroneopterin aldolase / 2-amino-4-hydroxy-6-hydroxymethyldihydropteridine diphosphokinase
VLLDMEFPSDIRKASRRDIIQEALDYKKIAKAAIAFVEKSRFHLIETLAQRLADHLLERFQLEEIFLRVSKPGAIRGSQNVGVEIKRRLQADLSQPERLVFFSLGSNIEPSLHLGNALREMGERFAVQTVSRVYETSPVGGWKKRPFFWNMAAAVETENRPEKIRRWISGLEKKEGRIRTKNPNVSRTLDVDLILWKDRVIHKKAYCLPHPDIATRAHVLFPLLEIAPTLLLPGSGKPLMELAACFKHKPGVFRCIPGSALSRNPSAD